MKRILTVLLLLSGGTGAARAVPVVPNFTQGSMTSHTETTSTVTETINSMDYATGWTYSVSGTGVELEEGSTNVAPDVDDTTTPLNERSMPSTDSSKLNVASVPLPAGNEPPVKSKPNTIPFDALNVVSLKPESAFVNVAPETENWNPPKSYSES